MPSPPPAIPSSPPPSQRLSFDGVAEYSEYKQHHTYTDVSGLRVIPRADRNTPPKLVRVHADYGKRTVNFAACRNGRPPVVPAAGDLDADTYLGGVVTIPLPAIDPTSGAYNWTVAGAYTYIQGKNRKAGSDPLPTGGYPFPVVPQDNIASQVAAGVSPTSGDYAIAPSVTEAIGYALGRTLVDHTTLYSWPFTTFPAESAGTYLITG